jgi:hypothetical protein
VDSLKALDPEWPIREALNTDVAFGPFMTPKLTLKVVGFAGAFASALDREQPIG